VALSYRNPSKISQDDVDYNSVRRLWQKFIKQYRLYYFSTACYRIIHQSNLLLKVLTQYFRFGTDEATLNVGQSCLYVFGFKLDEMKSGPLGHSIHSIVRNLQQSINGS
jgi:hypothetical protein